MWILGLEAGGAALLLIFIVWWTMFSGREPEQPARARQPARPPAQQQDIAQPTAQPGDKDAPGA